jgi:hypothetical protein
MECFQEVKRRGPPGAMAAAVFHDILRHRYMQVPYRRMIIYPRLATLLRAFVF